MLTLFTDGASCNSNSGNNNARTKGQGQALAVGTWGGQHVRAEVSEQGVELEFDCAQGHIAQKIVLDNAGGFAVSGTFGTQRPGPTRDDESSSSRTVQYKGTVKDNEMQLAVSDPKSKEDLGSFNLKFGNEGRLMKCR